MANWPNKAGMNAFYGNPDSNNDGARDPKWQADNLTTIVPPYAMVLAWDGNGDGKLNDQVRKITVHKKCADSLLRALTAIKAHYGTQANIEAARMHLFGGVDNFRVKRGQKGLSVHAYAAAIDLDPARNGFGVKYDAAKGMMPKAVVEIFAREGWVWGGLWSKADAMHFQAAAV